MSHRTSARCITVLLSAASFAACSGQSPVTPGALPAAGASLDARGSSGVPGVYALAFFARVSGTFQEVNTLPVLSAELILKAQVTDTSGNPAALGSVTFEYCSYSKLPPNDITRADEAPKEACEQGLAKWARLQTVSVTNGGNCLALGSGTACAPFGSVRIPRTIGFRFRYAQQKGSIASGTSDARNFTWTAQ